MATTIIRKSKGAVETSSRLRVWWLNTFHGYHVFEQKLCPHEGAFGRITYKTVWLLRRPDGKKGPR